jgi:hypothetical protein
LFVGFLRATELSFFERKRKLANKEDSLNIAILLQTARVVKNL